MARGRPAGSVPARRRSAVLSVAPLVLAAWLALGVAASPARLDSGAVQATNQTETASYRLEARLDPALKQVHGSGRIRYRNPSADTLDQIWLRLYLNAFRSPDTLWLTEAGEGHRGESFDPANPGWIKVESLTLAGSGTPLEIPDGGDGDSTIVPVALPQPLGPGEMLELDVRWTSQLPRVFASTGFSDDFFMVAQWYPKLAVYDRGEWDTEPWHANAEFFHDFGSYDLAVTVPSGYVTGASGARVADIDNADGTRTVRYRAERVTDVAWTAWPRYQVVSRDIAAAGATVQVELLLPAEQLGQVERQLAAVQAALDLYGRWYGPYPWPRLTVVTPPAGAEGAGGMEYPSLVTIGSGTELPMGMGRGIHDLENLIVHEIAHEWFPMQMQSNEAREAWLDEGFANYLAARVLDRMFGADRSTIDLPFARLGATEENRAYFLLIGGAARQPLARPSWEYPADTYAPTVYGKGSLALMTLERLYGDERFTAALRAHADRWRWGHPTSADLQDSLESSLGEDLDWFFQAFVSGDSVVDYRVGSVEGNRAVVEREGEAHVPVQVRIGLADGSSREQRWDGVSERLELEEQQPIVEVAIDPDQRLALEVDRFDNVWTQQPEALGPLVGAQRWLGIAQALLQLLSQIG